MYLTLSITHLFGRSRTAIFLLSRSSCALDLRRDPQTLWTIVKKSVSDLTTICLTVPPPTSPSPPLTHSASFLSDDDLASLMIFCVDFPRAIIQLSCKIYHLCTRARALAHSHLREVTHFTVTYGVKSVTFPRQIVTSLRETHSRSSPSSSARKID